MWGNLYDDNVVWGNRFDDDNIVWGNGLFDDDNIVWGNNAVLGTVYQSVGGMVRGKASANRARGTYGRKAVR